MNIQFVESIPWTQPPTPHKQVEVVHTCNSKTQEMETEGPERLQVILSYIEKGYTRSYFKGGEEEKSKVRLMK